MTMTKTGATSLEPSSYRFTRVPAELRIMIWQHFFKDNITPFVSYVIARACIILATLRLLQRHGYLQWLFTMSHVNHESQGVLVDCLVGRLKRHDETDRLFKAYWTNEFKVIYLKDFRVETWR